MTSVPSSFKSCMCGVILSISPSRVSFNKPPQNQLETTSISYLRNKGSRTETSLGHLPPSSNPRYPASLPSWRHCSTVVSRPNSGMSSLVHDIGLTPIFTLIYYLQIVSNIYLASLTCCCSNSFNLNFSGLKESKSDCFVRSNILIP